VRVAEERLKAEHVLAGRGLRQAGAHASKGIADVLDRAERGPPPGSLARKRLAVSSKLRLVWGELRDRSHDFSSASLDPARVAPTSVMGTNQNKAKATEVGTGFANAPRRAEPAPM
jgi:hypothetical protein